jgi:carboxyl-terminal processing protease
MGRAEAELKKLGVDWSLGEDQGPSLVTVTATTDRKDNIGVAGQPFNLKVTVENKGSAPLYQLRATTKSDNRLFASRELVFGKLSPGEKRTWTTTLGVCKTDEETQKHECILPETLRERADGIRIEFEEAHGHKPEPGEVRTSVQELPVPQFAYTVNVADDVRGNGDGEVQLGEIASVYLRIKNVGKGVSEETVANLRNLAGPGVLLHAGRFQLERLAPGQEAKVAFKFEVLPDFEGTEAKLETSIADELLREGAGEKITLAVSKTAETSPEPATGMVVASAGAKVLERPSSSAKPVAEVQGGAIELPLQAKLNGFARVDLGGGRPGWISERELRGGSGRGGHLVDILAHMPPKLEVDYGKNLVTREALLPIKGRATDDTLVRDVYVFVGSHKVFYRSNRKASDRRSVSFDTTIPLRPGVNYVTVVAREDNEIMSRQTFVVRRDGPDGALLETPKESELDFYELVGGGSGEEGP